MIVILHFTDDDRRKLDVAERTVIEAALRGARGNITHAADVLGLHRTSLQRKMRKHGLR